MTLKEELTLEHPELKLVPLSERELQAEELGLALLLGVKPPLELWLEETEGEGLTLTLALALGLGEADLETVELGKADCVRLPLGHELGVAVVQVLTLWEAELRGEEEYEDEEETVCDTHPDGDPPLPLELENILAVTLPEGDRLDVIEGDSLEE